jgi:1,4-dihydroxy-2-naphthoyl-CoA hydrolase
VNRRDPATEQLHELLPFARTLGITLVTHQPHEVRCRLDRTEHLAGAGVGLHGGAIMGLADAAAGICAFLNLPDGASGTTTIQSSTSFCGQSAPSVEAIARPVRCGRSVIVIDIDVTDAGGALAARVTQSQLVLHPRQ